MIKLAAALLIGFALGVLTTSLSIVLAEEERERGENDSKRIS